MNLKKTSDNTHLNLLLRFLCVISFSTLMFTAWGEKPKMAVESFEPVDTDVTSILEGSIREDQNGEKCALIKIQTVEHGFMFDVGSLGVVEVVEQNSEHPGEIWLYVPNGVKSITIQHPQLGTINDYDLGGRVKKGKTYLLKLTSDQVNTLVVDYNNSQLLRTEIVPQNATFYINGVMQNLNSDGISEIQLPFGTHTYRATAENYHPAEGRITINNKDEKHELNINLKQAFGYLSIDASKDSEGADVYVDDSVIGQIPMVNAPVKSGSHRLTVNKKLFLPYTDVFEMSDSAFVRIKPVLTPNFADVSVLVANSPEAQIYADGEYLGIGSWKGKLEAGFHRLEAREDKHVSSAKDVEIKNGMKADINLPAPTPILGSFELNTNPAGAQVIIDNKDMGTTPFLTNDLLIGNHKVEVVKKGYRTEYLDVLINEGKKTTERIDLTDFCSAVVSAVPSYARIEVDGTTSSSPYKMNLVAGNYRIKVSARGYTPYSKTLYLDGNTKDFTVRLNWNYIRENEFYLQAGYNATAFSGITAGIGGYIKNINLECNYIMGLSDSEKIYWNDKTGDVKPIAATYRPSGGNLKVGYGIRVHDRIRLTPQIGARIVSLKENIDKSGYNSSYDKSLANGANAISATAGAKINVAVAKCLGISVSPEYLIGVSKSDGFKALSDLSSKIKGYSEGFGCNVSVNLFF